MELQWLKHNFWMKFGALILAVILWFYVAGEETVESSLKVPVQLILAEGMVSAGKDSGELEVLIRGRKDVINKLTDKDLISKIDLTNYKEPQTVVVPVERCDIPFSPDISVLNIQPKNLTVKIDRLMNRILPIRVISEGEPAPGYCIEGFVIDPISAKVSGPEGYLKDLVYINTEPVDITGRQKSFKKMTALKQIPGSEGSPPQFVEVIIKIGEAPKTKVKR